MIFFLIFKTNETSTEQRRKKRQRTAGFALLYGGVAGLGLGKGISHLKVSVSVQVPVEQQPRWINKGHGWGYEIGEERI